MKNICLAILGSALLTGCASHPSARIIRVLDDTGAPLENAKIILSYMVPYSVPIWNTGPTDRNGEAPLNGNHTIRKESHAIVTTESEVIGFDYARFGALKDGVLTLSTWRGTKTMIPESDSPDTLSVPSVYLSKDKK